jgi:hypothetical protein
MRTDMMYVTKVIVAFRGYADTPKNEEENEDEGREGI